jgi:hypothetical protein
MFLDYILYFGILRFISIIWGFIEQNPVMISFLSVISTFFLALFAFLTIRASRRDTEKSIKAADKREFDRFLWETIDRFAHKGFEIIRGLQKMEINDMIYEKDYAKSFYPYTPLGLRNTMKIGRLRIVLSEYSDSFIVIISRILYHYENQIIKENKAILAELTELLKAYKEAMFQLVDEYNRYRTNEKKEPKEIEKMGWQIFVSIKCLKNFHVFITPFLFKLFHDCKFIEDVKPGYVDSDQLGEVFQIGINEINPPLPG